MQPEAFDPYVYKARVHRPIDGDSIKLNRDKGFGDWHICTVYPGSEKEARYPQGVYRLAGIDTPEKYGSSKAAGLVALARVNELIALGNDGDGILIRTRKDRVHGKYCYLLDILVPVDVPDDGIDYDEERANWLSDEDLQSLIDQATKDSGPTVIRALVTEVMHTRRQSQKVIHVNQQLLDEGLAVPYFGGRKKR